MDKIFKLKENNTNVLTEFIAGLTTFMAMSYIIFINPTILSETGMEYNSVYMATILASMIGTLILGLFANVPYVQSAGLGINALFTYTICGSLGYTWQQALAMVFICGFISFIITLTSVRKKIIKAIPSFMQEAITVGIGLFITYIGLKNSGIIEFSVSAVNNGIANAADVVPQLAHFSTAPVILSLIGLIITSMLVVKKVKGAYLIGILLTTLIGIPMKVTPIPDFTNYQALPSMAPTFLKLDFTGLFTAKSGIVVAIMTIFTLCISDLFDTIGTFIGTGKKSGIFKIDENGNMSKNLERAMISDSLATTVGALFGTSNVTTYVESSAGIEVGGRTGLTAVFAAICFGVSLFLAPLVECVPMAAISPVLILIGVSMIENIGKIDWKDILIAVPAFFIVIMMPLSYSITTGIQFGFIFYALVGLVSNKRKEISPLIYIFSILFIISFVYQAFM
ncbi:MAG: NCS2 family permease [Clostridia bacterium]|nr:NCS2 family permease [Clostridia bacterium]